MTKEQWYARLLERCNNEFDDFKKYLEGKPMPYLFFGDRVVNKLEFHVGSRSVLLTYHIDIKNFIVIFKTYEIVMNENEYGKSKLNELTDLQFKSVISESYYLDKDGMQISLPHGYINKLEKQFDTI